MHRIALAYASDNGAVARTTRCEKNERKGAQWKEGRKEGEKREKGKRWGLKCRYIVTRRRNDDDRAVITWRST